MAESIPEGVRIAAGAEIQQPLPWVRKARRIFLIANYAAMEAVLVSSMKEGYAMSAGSPMPGMPLDLEGC